MLLSLAVIAPFSTMAQVGISINIGLPPPIVFSEPPVVIVLPDTYYVYAVPGIEVDLFFWNGWWWRPWHGRWYRSRYYDRGWVYYDHAPRFYFDVDPGWRGYYRGNTWSGHHWYYERIDQQRLQRNWQRWQTSRHWDKEQAWGVQNYRPRPEPERHDVRQQRQREYDQRPEVQQYHRERQQQQRPPQQVQPPRQQPQERVQEPQRQEHGAQGEHPEHGKPQGKPEGKGGGHRK
jgi:hypothetical protein